MGRPRNRGGWNHNNHNSPVPPRCVDRHLTSTSPLAAAPEKQGVIYSTFSPNHLLLLNQHSNPSLRELVAQMGMPGLLTMHKLGNISRIIYLWLLSLLDPETMQLDLGEGEKLDIDDAAVGKALGISCTGEVVAMGTPANRDELLGQIHTVLGTGMPPANNVPVARLKSMIVDAKDLVLNEDENLPQLAAYTMVAGATFLLPRQNSNPRVPDELLRVVAVPSDIKKYNLARIVVDGLRQSAMKVRSSLPVMAVGSDITVEGCNLALQILFLDRMEHGAEGVKHLPGPRIGYYTDALLKQLLRKHCPKRLSYSMMFQEQEHTPVSSLPGAPAYEPIAIAAATPSWGGAACGRRVHQGDAGQGGSNWADANGIKSARSMLNLAVGKMGELDGDDDGLIGKAYKSMRQNLDSFYVDAQRFRQSRESRRKRCVEDVIGYIVDEVHKRQATSSEEDKAWWAYAEDFLLSIQIDDSGTSGTARVPVGTVNPAATPGTSGTGPNNQAAPVTSSVQDKHVDYKGKGPQTSGDGSIRDVIIGGGLTPQARGGGNGIVIQDGVQRTGTPIAEGQQPCLHQRLAKYTPIRNRRLQLPEIPEHLDHPVMDDEESFGQGPRVPISVPDYPVPQVEFGFSPFELEIAHRKYSDEICLDFYDAVMQTTGSVLDSTWFKHVNPTTILMDGNKMKQNFDVTKEMMYTGLAACLLNFNEREIEMMRGRAPGHPFWRVLTSLDLALHFTTTLDPDGQQRVITMFNTAVRGYKVKECRMIMVPLPLGGVYVLYVYDRYKKRVNVLDPVFTLEDTDAYKVKHRATVKTILKAIKQIGESLDDGWTINCSEWSVRFNNGMHLPCEPDDSAAYILHYAEYFDGTQLEVNIPLEGVKKSRKMLLYPVMAMDGNIGEVPGFMLRE